MNFPSQPGVFRWEPAAWLRVSGGDAANFLQGQFTNDLRPLIEGAVPAVYGLWLNVKGKVLADSFIVKYPSANEFGVCSYFCPAAVIRERLESFVIADDVTVEDQTARWSGVTVFHGGESGRHEAAQAAGHRFPGRRSHLPHTEWIAPPAVAATIGALVGPHQELTATEVEAMRIDAMIPAVPADVGPTDLPNEAGLEVDAISYTKGCYLGQEVMARLKSMGQIRRRLLRVRGTGGASALPAPLFLEARQVGELRTAIATKEGGRGLAMLNLLHLKPDTRLSFTPNGAPQVELESTP